MFKVSASLLFLTRLRAGAKLRQMLRSLKTGRGALLYGFGLVMFGLAFMPALIGLAAGKYTGGFDVMAKLGPEVPRMCISGLMLLYCVLVLLKPGKGSPIPFELAEVDFLFAGPYRRSELLVHKLGTFSLRMLPTAVIFSVVSLMASLNFVAAFTGMFLSFAFVLLFPTLVGMAGQTLSVRLYTPARRLAALGLTVLAVLSAWQALSGAIEALEPSEEPLLALRSFSESTALRWILAPFAPFSHTITATRLFPDLFLWGGLAACVNLALVAAIVRLDADYFEASLEVSRKVHENMKRIREGGVFAALNVRSDRPVRVQWNLPDFPYLAGAGVLVWRQVTMAVRGASRLILILALTCLPLGIVAVVAFAGDAWPLVAMVGAGSALYLPAFLRFDFRADLNKMDWMKALPLNPLLATLGQLATPVAIASAFQVFLAGAGAAMAGALTPLLLVILFAPLLNTLMFAVENLFFLLFPTRIATMMAPGDFAAMGRMYLMFLLRGGVYLVGLGAIAVMGGLVYWLTDSLIAVVIVVWLALAVGAGGAVFLTARAFERFDVSADVPA